MQSCMPPVFISLNICSILVTLTLVQVTGAICIVVSLTLLRFALQISRDTKDLCDVDAHLSFDFLNTVEDMYRSKQYFRSQEVRHAQIYGEKVQVS